MVKCTLDHLLDIVTYTSWQDIVPIKQQKQSLVCSSLDTIGSVLDHPQSVAYTGAHLLPFLDTVLANIMSKNAGCAKK